MAQARGKTFDVCEIHETHGRWRRRGKAGGHGGGIGRGQEALALGGERDTICQ